MEIEGFSSWSRQRQHEALLEPALHPPGDLESNLANPPHQTTMGLAITILCTVAGGVSILLRIYSTFLTRSKLKIEDALGAIATGTFVGVLYVGYGFAKIDGFFVHQWDVNYYKFSEILYLSYLLSSFYCLTMLFTKSAILVEWIRIFVPNRKRNSFFWISAVTILLNAVYFISAFIFIQFQCKPRQKIWDRWIEGTCTDRGIVDKISGYVNIVLDIIIAVLPQRIIWKLHTSLERKIGLSVVFGIGLIGIGCATGRAHNNHIIDFHGDLTWSMAQAYLWAVGECTVGLLIYCMPVIPRAFTEFRIHTSTLSNKIAVLGTVSRRERFTGGAGSRSGTQKASRASTVPHNTMYRRMEDGSSEVQLTNLESTRKTSLPDDPDDGLNGPPRGILRTMEITTEIVTLDGQKVEEPGSQDWVKQQHPWINPRSDV